MNPGQIIQLTLALADLAYGLGTLVQASERADAQLGPVLAELAELRERLAAGEATEHEVEVFIHKAMAPLDAAIARL